MGRGMPRPYLLFSPYISPFSSTPLSLHKNPLSMNYPLLSEYCEAVKYAADNFNELSHLTPVLDTNGNPVMSSGNFAVVFRMHDAKANKDVAVKCFLREQEGRAESYRLIAQELAYTPSPFFTPIRYLDQELFVSSQSTTDEEFPAVVMDWIAGDTLDRYVQAHLSDPNALRLLTFQFSRLASWLLSQPFAHGDLKPDNILVRPDGTLALVDYDGMFVPAMKGTSARELGSPDFRHPLRTPECFNDHIDDFPLASILLSLKALSLSPSLWQTYGAADRLLFSATDYCDLASCPLLRELPTLFADPELPRLYALFLLAYTEGELNNASINLINLSMVEEGKLSTEVTEEEIEEGVKDEYGVTYSKDGLRLLKGNRNLETYMVRKGTRVICDGAFCYCYGLTNITLPQGVERIGDRAFSSCEVLTSITLPQGVKSIGNGVFSSCKALTSITLPQGVKSIGNGAFSSCKALTSITLPQGVKSIGDCTFSNCKALTSITLPQGIERIGNYTFSNCKALTSITLPQGVESIGNEAFYYCDALTSIRIPKGTLAHFQRILPSYLHEKFREC